MTAGQSVKVCQYPARFVQKDYDVLEQKLNQRFGNKDLPHTIRRQLQEAKQLFDESLEDFSERVQEMPLMAI